ncbi:uncharacterized protein LOC62_04G005276 [Vanrija pseudolonga]|uniref:F-box domain-containing protein n=1 Tax=Vanrija pseudolonga TaxID=143232 RepID=A0AAF0Y7Z1_9TREE|nr:hypothetical protein LOC62_04G005276 [Vanrija pseudolonga]
MDSTAYPNILERVIQHCYSVATLLAFRAASKHCRAIADDTLFYHAVLRREWYQPTPKGRARAAPRPHLALLLTIQQDRPLPLLPAKCTVLDLKPTLGGEPPSYDRIYRTRKTFEIRERMYPTSNNFDHGAIAGCAPAVLRRFGDAVQVKWEAVQPTAVDFVCAGKPYVSQLIVVPPRARRYILHLDWTTFEPPRGWLSLGGHSKAGIPDAVLVLTPRTAAIARDTVAEIIKFVAKEFLPSMMLGRTVFTVVGLGNWLPGVDTCAFKERLTDIAVSSHFAYLTPNGGLNMDVDTVEKGYDSIRFITLEEWQASLGRMNELVGMWPCPAQHVP